VRILSRQNAACVAGALAALVCGAAQAATNSGVFCLNQKGLSATFAGRVEPDGRLKFGLSAWGGHGDLTLITGFGDRDGTHWQFVKNLGSKDERARCKLRIDFGPRSGVRIVADPNASCVDDGGLGRIAFTAKNYQGPVTVELNDPVDLVEDPPGLLGKGECAKDNSG
jgi:hypothetical protein